MDKVLDRDCLDNLWIVHHEDWVHSWAIGAVDPLSLEKIVIFQGAINRISGGVGNLQTDWDA